MFGFSLKFYIFEIRLNLNCEGNGMSFIIIVNFRKKSEFIDWPRSICIDRLEDHADGSIKQVKQTGLLKGPK